MDGNFVAEHQHMRNPEEEVWLSDGDGYFVENTAYKEYVRTTSEQKQVRLQYTCAQLQYWKTVNSDQHATIIKL